MRDNTFSKKVFIKTVSDNLKNKYRKTIDDATQQELYQAVSEAVKDVIMDEWIATQRVMDKDDPKVVYYMNNFIYSFGRSHAYHGVREKDGFPLYGNSILIRRLSPEKIYPQNDLTYRSAVAVRAWLPTVSVPSPSNHQQ